MVLSLKLEVPLGTSLEVLMEGFVLTKQTEDKSSRMLEYYWGNLKQFTWYTERQGWSDDTRLITEWHSCCADIFILVGSSLVVYPAADIPQIALESGSKLVIINEGDTPLEGVCHLRFREKAGEV
jgi:hypothetical protein